ncbi:DUF2431 domain-containing protein [Mycena indigotica]|uniref:DUF2431 domain-containing protein n=1 Tax=Mycena indigotica TaxID=2126181 RepID=A0A8H6SWJ1_9AGAR|nr:DUF2431 domain-containing protein [Mycena indigotica]KAF7307243.1 DUF2431 domain-containing protein [Mycena indigotica]
MAKSKKPLKAALQSQQSRLRLKEKEKAAALSAELVSKKNGKGKGKEIAKDTTSRPTIPFLETDRILLIGEGNFSFALALVRNPPAIAPELQHLPSKNVTATAYDTEEECYEKYPEAVEIVAQLRESGAEVLFAVDATQLNKVGAFKGRRWDKIVWNFPHAGKGIADQDRNILSNQLLILSFLRSASGFLVQGPIPAVNTSRKRKTASEEDEDDEVQSSAMEAPPVTSTERGRVLITLRNVVPYTQWDVPRLAKKPTCPNIK